MATCDVSQLMEDGKCFSCLNEKQMRAVILQLLCELKESLAAHMAAGPTVEALTYATPMTLDFDGADYQTLTLAGDINFSASTNRPSAGSAKSIAVVIQADGSDRTFTFNANWTFVGAEPTGIAAGKLGVLSLTGLGSAETDVVCAYQEEE